MIRDNSHDQKSVETLSLIHFVLMLAKFKRKHTIFVEKFLKKFSRQAGDLKGKTLEKQITLELLQNRLPLMFALKVMLPIVCSLNGAFKAADCTRSLWCAYSASLTPWRRDQIAW